MLIVVSMPAKQQGEETETFQRYHLFTGATKQAELVTFKLLFLILVIETLSVTVISSRHFKPRLATKTVSEQSVKLQLNLPTPSSCSLAPAAPNHPSSAPSQFPARGYT